MSAIFYRVDNFSPAQQSFNHTWNHCVDTIIKRHTDMYHDMLKYVSFHEPVIMIMKCADILL